jgi:hypothetical protein
MDDNDFPSAQQRVFDQNWFDIFPPTVTELEDAVRHPQREE